MKAPNGSFDGFEVVGTGRFELPTCRLGGGRSIHLSYVPTSYLLYLTLPFTRFS